MPEVKLFENCRLYISDYNNILSRQGRAPGGGIDHYHHYELLQDLYADLFQAPEHEPEVLS